MEMPDYERVLGAFAAIEHFMFEITGDPEYMLSADKADKLLNEISDSKVAKQTINEIERYLGEDRE